MTSGLEGKGGYINSSVVGASVLTWFVIYLAIISRWLILKLKKNQLRFNCLRHIVYRSNWLLPKWFFIQLHRDVSLYLYYYRQMFCCHKWEKNLYRLVMQFTKKIYDRHEPWTTTDLQTLVWDKNKNITKNKTVEKGLIHQINAKQKHI